VNVVFVMPMLLVYLVCRFTVGEAIENQAAESLRDLLRLLGRRTAYFLMLTTGVALGTFAIRRLVRGSADVRVFPAMVVEGVLYGLLLGGLAQALSRVAPVGRWFGVGLFGGFSDLLTVPGGARGLGIAVGAGIFEELLFRGLVCFALYRVVRSVLGADRYSAGTVAVVVSAFLFSAYHHWGVGGEPWDAARFTFRFHAGVLLGVVFLTRGIGIAALAHGFYDAVVLLG